MTTRPKKKKEEGRTQGHEAIAGQEDRGEKGEGEKSEDAREKARAPAQGRPEGRKSREAHRAAANRAVRGVGPPPEGRSFARPGARPRDRTPPNREARSGCAARSGRRDQRGTRRPLYRGTHAGRAALPCRIASRIRSGPRERILAARAEQQERYDAGDLPDFRPTRARSATTRIGVSRRSRKICSTAVSRSPDRLIAK